MLDLSRSPQKDFEKNPHIALIPIMPSICSHLSMHAFSFRSFSFSLLGTSFIIRRIGLNWTIIAFPTYSFHHHNATRTFKTQQKRVICFAQPRADFNLTMV